MKKIIIFYASYGGGHLSAAKSLEKHLNESINEIVDILETTGIKGYLRYRPKSIRLA